MIKQWIIGTLAVAAIAASLYGLLHTPAEKGEQLATDASEALGQRAGLEVAQMLGNQGQIAVVGLDVDPGKAPTYAAQVEAFTKSLKKHGVAITQTKAISGGVTGLVMRSGLSAEDYTGLLQKATGANAIVTFVGLPHLTAEELQKIQAGHPPLVVVDLFGVMKEPLLGELMEQKTVALAIVPRTADEVAAAPADSKIFERYYRIVRPAAAVKP
jgi:hypothetical protein